LNADEISLLCYFFPIRNEWEFLPAPFPPLLVLRQTLYPNFFTLSFLFLYPGKIGRVVFIPVLSSAHV